MTEALSPAVLVAGVSVAVAWHGGSPGWGVVAAAFASAIPIGYVLRGVRRGRYSDHHVPVRRGRLPVLAVAAGSVSACLALTVALHAPRELVALSVAMLAGLALTVAVTAFWKVSIHTAVASGTATTLVLVFGPWFLLVLPGPALVGWSRVRLGDHTVAQAVVGAALGAIAAGPLLLAR